MSYHYTKDIDSSGPFGEVEEKYHQVSMGFFHAVNESFTLGTVINDLMGEKKIDSTAIVGFQYVYHDLVSLLGDIGTNYHENFSSNILYRGALQIKLLQDIFLKGGFFYDRGIGEKGNGAGISWAGPKFIIDLGIKNIKPIRKEATNNIAYTTNVRETSFSLSYRF